MVGSLNQVTTELNFSTSENLAQLKQITFIITYFKIMPHIHDKIDFVVTAYIVHSGNVLLIHHKQLNTWLPVGGHIELDEHPDQALFREIKEETGLEKKDITLLTSKPTQKFSELKFLYTPNFLDIHKISDSHQHIGLTYILKSKTDKLKLAKQEHHDINWFSLPQIKQPDFNTRPNVIFYAQKALST